MGGFKRDWEGDGMNSLILYSGTANGGYNYKGWADFDHTPVIPPPAESTTEERAKIEAKPDPELKDGHVHLVGKPAEQIPFSKAKHFKLAADFAKTHVDKVKLADL
jgi:hypothetical protein